MVNCAITIMARAQGEQVGRSRWSIAVAAAASAAGFAAPAAAATITVQAKAKVTKPLALSSVQDLDLGTVVLGPGSWSGATLRLSRTGALTCPASVTCTGATQVAIYKISGTNGETATINAPDVTLVNLSDPSKSLNMVVDKPGSVTFTNSGNAGINFQLGGAIVIDSTTPAGQYVGTFQVTAEYQ